jgi:hypothetical protein
MHFPHTFRQPETFFQKRSFLPSEVVKTVAHTSRPPEIKKKKILFTVWSG